MNNESNNVSIKQYNCPSCGSALKLSSIDNGYVQCSFCGAQVALQGKFFSSIKNVLATDGHKTTLSSIKSQIKSKNKKQAQKYKSIITPI